MLKLLKQYMNQEMKVFRYQLVYYFFGIVLFSLGAKCFIDAQLGTDPLDVLVIGLNKHLGVGLGVCSSLIAILFLSWWMVWNRALPPMTPFVSTSAVGFLLDFWNALHVEQYTIDAMPVVNVMIYGHELNLYAVLLDVIALLVCSYASSLIIMSGIGIRIMDLVAITMIEKWGWSFFRAKMTLEIGLFSVGWLLGGPMGVTTVLFLFFVGPFIQPFMLMNATYLRIPNHGINQPHGENSTSVMH
ncbi:MAG TPA: hypothetical protein HPQ00_05455 [Magnetococcales bacterium]|nr:hypothetical protein [Magnetococcales bacterium]